MTKGTIFIAGIGPGKPEWMAPAVGQILQSVDVILGYQTYLKQIASLAPHVARESSGMHHEIERAQRAIELARQGKQAALISGGDAGVYAMAGLVFEILETEQAVDIPVEVLPGITALTAAAALLGAPLMNDFAAISLSDYLTPLEVIRQRLQAAIAGDFVIGLYNPKSHKRTQPFKMAVEMLLEGFGEDRPVGIVRAAYRDAQEVHCIQLCELADFLVGMDCIIIVGNSTTRMLKGKMVTARGYDLQQGKEA